MVDTSPLMSVQNSDAVAITGGTIAGVTITGSTLTTGVFNGTVGATTPSTGSFTSLTASTTFNATGAATLGSTLGVTGAITPTGGIVGAAGSVARTVFHSGDNGATTTTTGTDTTPSTTTTYIAEVYIEGNCTLTGVSFLSGSANAGNIAVALANSAGVIVASSGSVATAGTAAYQQVPFTGTYAAIGPAKYFILLQNNNTSNRFRSHILGNFGASTKTGETFATFTTVTAPTTFTTNVGPIADTY